MSYLGRIELRKQRVVVVEAKSKASPEKKRSKTGNENATDWSWFDHLDDATMMHIMCILDIKTMRDMIQINKHAFALYKDPAFQKRCVIPKKTAKERELTHGDSVRSGYHKKTFWKDDVDDPDKDPDGVYHLFVHGWTSNGLVYEIHFKCHTYDFAYEQLEKFEEDLANGQPTDEPQDKVPESPSDREAFFIRSYGPIILTIPCNLKLRAHGSTQAQSNQVAEIASVIVGLYATEFMKMLAEIGARKPEEPEWRMAIRMVDFPYLEDKDMSGSVTVTGNVKSLAKQVLLLVLDAIPVDV